MAISVTMSELRPGDDLHAVLDTLECPQADCGGDLDFIDVRVLNNLGKSQAAIFSGIFPRQKV